MKRYKTFNITRKESVLETDNAPAEGEVSDNPMSNKEVWRNREDLVEFEYKLKMKKEEEGIEFVRVLRQIPNVENVRFNIQDTFEEV